MTAAASPYSPSAIAPTDATVIRKFSSKILPLTRFLPVEISTGIPAARYEMPYTTSINAHPTGPFCDQVNCKTMPATKNAAAKTSRTISRFLPSSGGRSSCASSTLTLSNLLALRMTLRNTPSSATSTRMLCVMKSTLTARTPSIFSISSCKSSAQAAQCRFFTLISRIPGSSAARSGDWRESSGFSGFP